MTWDIHRGYDPPELDRIDLRMLDEELVARMDKAAALDREAAKTPDPDPPACDCNETRNKPPEQDCPTCNRTAELGGSE